MTPMSADTISSVVTWKTAMLEAVRRKRIVEASKEMEK